MCPLIPLGDNLGTYWFLSLAGEMRDATHRDMTENRLASLGGLQETPELIPGQWPDPGFEIV